MIRATGAVLVIAGCGGAARGPAQPDPLRSVTPLEVIVVDDYPTETVCAGVAPRRIEIALDARVVATVAVPCRTTVSSPPLQLRAAPFEVAPGPHRIMVREPETELATEVDITFPVFDPPMSEAEDDAERALATKLPVWANDRELEIHAARAELR